MTREKLRARSISVGLNTISLVEISPEEDEFVELKVDIAEQRKELKRSQQEKFDEMWG